MFPAVSVAKGICESYGISFRFNISGSLIFDYHNGQSEEFGENGHLVPLHGGFWSSRTMDLNIISQVYICSSAMEAIAFLHFNSSRFNRPCELLFVAISPHYIYPGEIFTELRKVKINLVLECGLVNTLRAIRFCMDYQGIASHFTFQDEHIFLRFSEHVLSIPQHCLSIRKVFLMANIRPSVRQYLPRSKISFLYEFLNQ
ncbi:hypothetical protein SAMN04488511_102231 [Pedobacter suwonensis]|uniref:Uncharacterized protein n=1 Tax=Pedobacter suwonensis TaxID=332999 RepID=A0A1I0SNI3_9SPHI|nr:hypothetical protein [Pedobacter suwonensis]SFA41058.1 hypothetical protein SAMN04488511_102231 [Pedobacter suwonensis]